MVLNAFYQVIAPNWSQCVSQPTTRRGWICEDLRETDRRVIRWLYLLYNDSLLWGNPGIYDQIRKPASTKKMNVSATKGQVHPMMSDNMTPSDSETGTHCHNVL